MTNTGRRRRLNPGILDARRALGIEIKKRLMERRMTQKDLADALGISSAFVYKMLKGDCFSFPSINKALDILDMSGDFKVV